MLKLTRRLARLLSTPVSVSYVSEEESVPAPVPVPWPALPGEVLQPDCAGPGEPLQGGRGQGGAATLPLPPPLFWPWPGHLPPPPGATKGTCTSSPAALLLYLPPASCTCPCHLHLDPPQDLALSLYTWSLDIQETPQCGTDFIQFGK